MNRQAFTHYRADIDGLRAVAIGGVVLYHAGIPGFGGGFVGVDVFFVISGYLMAALILDRIGRGEFSVIDFYERRIRRIFPALFVMIAASAAAAVLLLMPAELDYFSRSAVAAAFFGSNFLFWSESGYFDVAADLKPLLHTWSLAVEEQFYIVFPLLIATLARADRRWLAPISVLLFVCSLGLSEVVVRYAPTAAFYLLPSRLWELLLGSLLVIRPIPRPERAFSRQACASIGLALIGSAVFGYGPSTVFPGLSALAPCLGAALVIYAQAERTPVGALIGCRPMIFVGLISYSLYLWHWPLLVFGRILAGHELSTAQSCLAAACSLLLSALSWRFIEQPFRGRGSFIGRRTLFASAGAAIAASALFGVYVSAKKGLPDRLTPIAQRLYEAKYDLGPFASTPCAIDVDGKGPSLADVRSGALCGIGAKEGQIEFLVWGDSHAMAMAPAIDLAALKAGSHGLFVGRAGCPPLLEFDLGEARALRAEQCRRHNRAVLDLVSARRIPFVFMIGFWPKYVHRAELANKGTFYNPSQPLPGEDWSTPLTESLDRTLGALSRIGAEAILVFDVPEIGYDVPEALATSVTRGRTPDISPSWYMVEARQYLARKTLVSAASRHHAMTVDPLPALCDATRCRVEQDGVVLYRNSDHLTASGARTLSSIYSAVFDAIYAHLRAG